MTHEQPAIEPEVEAYWLNLRLIDAEAASRWRNAIFAFHAPAVQRPERRLRLLVTAIDHWEEWAIRIGADGCTLPDRATVGVHHMDIMCHPFMQLYVLQSRDHVHRLYGRRRQELMTHHAAMIVSVFGDQSGNDVRREAAGTARLSDEQWSKLWTRAAKAAASMGTFLSDLTDAPPRKAGSHAE